VRVLFWGTPAFAVPPLLALSGEGHDVVGVVTQPDRPVGRSRSTLVPSAVKEAALGEGIPVLQPERPRGEAFLTSLRELAPEISVVVAYGHILRQDVIDLPVHGTLNIHASLLPALRGAAPIQAAIRQGLGETGVSIMRMVLALDAGPVLLQQRTPILPDETYGELQLRLSELGALAIVESLALVSVGMATETPQDESLTTYAPKIDRATTRVDWSSAATEVSRVIRAFDPRPGAWTTLRGTDVKLYGGSIDSEPREGAAGEVLAIEAAGAVVACGNGAVRVAVVQPAGKKRLSARELERGRGLTVGERLGD
jgi:methionyl-tRNA formyltransferase